MQHLTASPTLDYLTILNSAGAHALKFTPNPELILQQSFGTGVTLDSGLTTGLPALKAGGNNTNIVLDLITKGTGTVRVNAQASTGTGGFEVYNGAATSLRVFGMKSDGHFVQHATAAKRDVAGTIAISAATSASFTFGTAYTAAPRCVLTPTSNPGALTWWVTTSTTAVTATISASGTITFNFVCIGNPN